VFGHCWSPLGNCAVLVAEKPQTRTLVPELSGSCDFPAFASHLASSRELGKAPGFTQLLHSAGLVRPPTMIREEENPCDHHDWRSDWRLHP
jgi:hypothetical protein